MRQGKTFTCCLCGEKFPISELVKAEQFSISCCPKCAQKNNSVFDLCRVCDHYILVTNLCDKKRCPIRSKDKDDNVKLSCPEFIRCPECYSCHIGVNQYHMERSLYKVGDKQVCGSCFSDLKRCGFVNMFDGSHLYKDGHVEKKQATSDVLDGDNDEQI